MNPAHIKEQREKEVRRIRKRQSAIYRERFDLGYAELEKPVRHGWYKELVLTVNVERYASRSGIEEVFLLLERQFWGRTKKECCKNWDAQSSKHLIVRDVPTISKKQFGKLSEKAQRLCTPYWFKENKKHRMRYTVRLPKPTVRIRYSRAYITHSKIIDPLLESELDLLDQRLTKQGYYNIHEKGCGKQKFWWMEEVIGKDRRKTKAGLRAYRNAFMGGINEIKWEKN